jgi:hypothetical protein
MQVTFHQIVCVITMGHGRMSAFRIVGMFVCMTVAGMVGGAVACVGEDVFVYMVTMLVMQMPVVQIVGMVVVFHFSVSAASAMGMVVVGVNFAFHLVRSFWLNRSGIIYPSILY